MPWQNWKQVFCIASRVFSMNDKPVKMTQQRADYAKQVGSKAARKLKAQQNATPGIWFGLGMMGLIGWSIVVPTLIGAALGRWLDNDHAGKHSWTLALLVAGLVIGCFNAWQWVAREDQTMRKEQEDKDA